MNLAKNEFGRIISDIIDGNIENFYENFKYGFGASISIWIEHARNGLPLFIKEDIHSKVYLYHSYLKDAKLKLSAYDNQVGIVTGFGYTIEDAGDEALEHTRKVNFPDKTMRPDFNKKDYHSSIIKRYEALRALRFVE